MNNRSALAESKLHSSARISGGLAHMSRRQLTRTLYRTVTRAYGAGRPTNASEFESTAGWGRPYDSYRPYATKAVSVNNTESPTPSDERLQAPLSHPGVRANVDAVRAQNEQRLRVNGFPKGRAKQNNEILTLRQQIPVPAAQARPAATPVTAATDNRITASFGAPDLASGGAAAGIAVPSAGFPAAPPPTPPPTPPPAALHTAAAAPSAAAATALSDDEDFELEVSDELVAEVYKNEPPPDVEIVATAEDARRVAALLASPEMAGRVFACDTEVMDIDVTKHSPCCHGQVICFSIYAGPDMHFGASPPAEGAPARSMLWVDTWLDGDEARQAEAQAIIDAFRPFWGDVSLKKVWHNYSFDRHVMERLGVSMKGFDGDTMHMARLWDSSRTGRGGYSLEALSSDTALMGPTAAGEVRGKVSMKKLFGRRNVKKDGTEGKLTVLPPVHDLQRDPDTKWRWVNYSAYDAKSTWDLHEALAAALAREPAALDAAVAAAYDRSGLQINSLWDLYRAVWRPFGEILTDMEAAGMAVDRSHLAAAEERAVREEEEAKARFRSWASSKVADAAYMNVGSGPQVSQLLFGGVPNRWPQKPGVPRERTFKVPNQLPPEEGKKPKKNMDITLHNVWGAERSPLTPEVYTPSGLPACSTPVLKALAGKPGRARKALAELKAEASTAAEGLEQVRDDGDEGEDTWSVEDDVIAQLQAARAEEAREHSEEELAALAKANGYGALFSHFKTIPAGLEACAAVDSLVDASAIDTLLSNFIVPLQSDDISKPDASGVFRVHCSLNINTETGRLSARRPNLQNQPALEKDRYRVRQAFTADRDAGKTLIVADYGQLELRILAHMADCASMQEAFRLGGDFHSRTALGMYDHIQDAVARGDCLLEWDGARPDGGWDPPPAPLLKDLFGSERRKAKVLNFSIAYGKTAHGLSKDWGVSLEEAKATVERWYADRPEVRAWQEEQYASAKGRGYVCTILGRRRQLPDAISSNKAASAHALRAAINTPIQGSAADVATAAMLRISADERLHEMGWRLLLQVHDEVILEGPKESADEAMAVVVECMRSPFGTAGGDPLRVELAVDAKHADTWYEAK